MAIIKITPVSQNFSVGRDLKSRPRSKAFVMPNKMVKSNTNNLFKEIRKMKKYIILLFVSCVWVVKSQAQSPQKISYAYDDLNRLSTVTYPNGTQIVYTYDALGNRQTQVVSTTGCTVPTATLSGTQIITSGQSATLSVALTGASPWSVVVNGVSYTATVSPYSFSVTPSITTTYTISSVSNSCGVGTFSGSAVVTVNAYTQMYTTKTGNWNDASVWSCNRIPTSTDVVTIKQNNFITIPASYTANVKNVIYETGGKIIEGANSKLCLSCP